MKRPFHKQLFYVFQAVAAYLGYVFFRTLPFGWASGLGGWVGRTIGPCISLSNRARKNLRDTFPEKSAPEIEAIVLGMWDNLGRVIGEFPHMNRINVYDPDGPVETVGGEHVDMLRDDGKPGIFVSAHIGNWEFVPLGVTQRGLPLDRVYREANNRLVEWLYKSGRAAIEGALIPKGPQGVRQLLKVFRDGGHLGIMADQRMNDGIPIPFFGRPAMTAPALADLGLRYDCPVVALRVTRLPDAKFRITIHPPITFENTGDRHKDIEAAMIRINQQIEEWVRDTPEQWLWLHNRWPANGEE